MQCVESERGHVFHQDGYVYRTCMKSNSGVRYFKCAHKRCNARCILQRGARRATISKPHKHPPDDVALEMLLLKAELRRKAAVSVGLKPRQIFDSVAQKFPRAASKLSYRSIRSTLYRHKIIGVPPDPYSWGEFQRVKQEDLTEGSTSREASDVSQATELPPPPPAAEEEDADDSYSGQGLWEPQPTSSEIKQSQISNEEESCSEYGTSENYSRTDNLLQFNTTENADGDNIGDHGEGSLSDMQDHDRPGGVMADTLDLFGQYVSSILRQLPVPTSYTLQQKFINEAISAKLEYEKEHPSPSPRHFDSQPRSDSPPMNGFQPIRLPSSSGVSREDTSKTKKGKSQKKSSRSDSTSVPDDTLSVFIPTIKQEPVDDVEMSDVAGEDGANNMLDDGSQIDIEDGPKLDAIKPERLTDFELVLCNEPLGQQTEPTTSEVNEGAQKLLEALRGAVKTKPPDSKTFTCSVCACKFSKISLLKTHYKDKHQDKTPAPNINQPGSEVTAQQTSGHSPRLKRPRLQNTAPTTPSVPTPPAPDPTTKAPQPLLLTTNLRQPLQFIAFTPTTIVQPNTSSFSQAPVTLPVGSSSVPVSLASFSQTSMALPVGSSSTFPVSLARFSQAPKSLPIGSPSVPVSLAGTSTNQSDPTSRPQEPPQ